MFREMQKNANINMILRSMDLLHVDRIQGPIFKNIHSKKDLSNVLESQVFIIYNVFKQVLNAWFHVVDIPPIIPISLL
jgi:hypothetical protein